LRVVPLRSALGHQRMPLREPYRQIEGRRAAGSHRQPTALPLHFPYASSDGRECAADQARFGMLFAVIRRSAASRQNPLHPAGALTNPKVGGGASAPYPGRV
jgi:hypothetical protein